MKEINEKISMFLNSSYPADNLNSIIASIYCGHEN